MATFKDIDKVGSGGFGLVTKCIREADGELFARKVLAKLLASEFARAATEQSWPFDYTDQIGTTCARFYAETSDPEIRGLMAATALSLGASHNRYYVMDIAAGLIVGAKDDSTALAIAHALEPRKGDLSALDDRLDETKLHPAIRELFAKAEGQ